MIQNPQIIISSNSNSSSDFVTDGIDDQVQINAALASLPYTGGSILICEGEYNLSAPVVIPDSTGVEILGMGKAVTYLNFSGLSGSLIVKSSPTTRRYKCRIAGLNIDNQDKDISAVGLGCQSLAECSFERVNFSNIETAIKVSGNSYFNNFYECGIQDCKHGIKLIGDESGNPNENTFYHIKMTGGFDTALTITNGNDNHFIACSFEDFITGVDISDYGNTFTNNRFESNDQGVAVTYIHIDSSGFNNGFVNNYYAGNEWSGRTSSIIDEGAGNSFIETSNYNDQFIQSSRNALTAGEFVHYTRSGSGNNKPLITAEDTYSNSGIPTSFLAKGVRGLTKFFRCEISGNEKFAVDQYGISMTGTVDSQWQPNQYGLKSWSYDPVIATSGSAPTSGLLNLIRVKLNKANTISNIFLFCSTAGVGVTNCYASLYNSSGTLLAQSADLSGSMGSAGLKTFSITPQNLSNGDYYIAFWATATTMPSFSRSTGNSIANSLLGSSYRYATADSGLTNTSPTTLGTKSNLSVGYWCGIN